MRDLNARAYLIRDENTCNGIFGISSRMVHDGGMPINELYWRWMKAVDDKCINMLNLRYIEYNDLINTNIKSLKKD